MEYFFFFLLGVLVSVMSGFFGIGGGFILTPFLMLIGYEPVEAITTSLLFTIGSSLSGIVAHLRMKNIYWKEGLLLGISGMAATQIAKPFVLFLEERGYDEWVIPMLYIVMLSYFSVQMLKKEKAVHKGMQKRSPGIGKVLIIGFGAGLVSTTLGVGGGFIIVPLSVAFLGFPSKKAVGTSLFAVLFIVSSGFVSYSFDVQIDLLVGLILVAGGLIGSQFGARLTNFFANGEITRLLGVLYVSTVISVIMKLVNFNTAGLAITALFLLSFFVIAFVRVRSKKKTAGEQ
ncbi:sulfite exporter TauE/SafE family protein [Cytobacillus gottheilii]|uniref:sulfite exporter TauE/SafE family protein n=1 Tax=Cytobacillus gottheilii TaxID=859144 RepID=UPI0024954BC3|nr:sulfite exporter TauE/SafE family protein [Cytobacillus gottheilii]